MSQNPRVLIVCENASAQFGGEAVLPLHYFRGLRSRGVEAWLIAHERTRAELLALLPDQADRMFFVADNHLNIVAWRLSRYMPAAISYATLGFAGRLSNQRQARRMARQLIKDAAINIVHQPMPVSPKEPSLLYDLGAPVIMGPMNGNMSYPAGFQKRGVRLLSGIVATGRSASAVLNRLMPGKLKASALLVANDRTAAGLPNGTRGEIIHLVENGVDLAVWKPSAGSTGPKTNPHFVFLGRLVGWKAVHIIIHAFSRLGAQNGTLEIIGDGPERQALEALVRQLDLVDTVHFSGWLSQSECSSRLVRSDVLLLPSIFECGGAVVLEAMACGKPVIATDWGGPQDYVDATTGILVVPLSENHLIEGFASAMATLAADPQLRDRLGANGLAKVKRQFNWVEKLDVIMEIYEKFRSRS